EAAMLDEAAYLGAALAPYGIAPEVLVVGVEPTAAEIEDAGRRAAAADASILCLYDAHLYASNRALLDALSRRARALAVVLMPDPYAAESPAPGVGGVTAFGWRRCQIEAALARLLAGPAVP